MKIKILFIFLLVVGLSACLDSSSGTTGDTTPDNNNPPSSDSGNNNGSSGSGSVSDGTGSGGSSSSAPTVSYDFGSKTQADLFAAAAGSYKVRIASLDTNTFPSLAKEQVLTVEVKANGEINLKTDNGTMVADSSAYAGFTKISQYSPTAPSFTNTNQDNWVFTAQLGTQTNYLIDPYIQLTLYKDGYIDLSYTKSYAKKLTANNAGMVAGTYYLGGTPGLPMLDKATGSYKLFVWQSTHPDFPAGQEYTFNISRSGDQGRISSGSLDITTNEPNSNSAFGNLADVLGAGFTTVAGVPRLWFIDTSTGSSGSQPGLIMNIKPRGPITGNYSDNKGSFKFTTSKTDEYKTTVPALFADIAGNYQANGYFFVSGPFAFSIAADGTVNYTNPAKEVCAVETLKWDGNNDYLTNGVNNSHSIQIASADGSKMVNFFHDNRGVWEFRIGAANGTNIYRTDSSKTVLGAPTGLDSNAALQVCNITKSMTRSNNWVSGMLPTSVSGGKFVVLGTTLYKIMGKNVLSAGLTTSYLGSSNGWLSATTNDLPVSVNLLYSQNGTVFVVGSDSRLYSSSDALTWADLGDLKQYINDNIKSIAGISGDGNNKLIIWGYRGTFATSADNGQTWVQNSSKPTSKNIKAVYWTGSQFVAVGDSGTILSSSDGNSWTSQSSGVTNNLNHIVSNSTTLLATSDDGVIITSQDNGTTWSKPLPDGVFSGVIDDAIVDGNNILIANNTNAMAYLTKDNGTTWSAEVNEVSKWSDSNPSANKIYQLLKAGSTIYGIGVGFYQRTIPQE